MKHTELIIKLRASLCSNDLEKAIIEALEAELGQWKSFGLGHLSSDHTEPPPGAQ